MKIQRILLYLVIPASLFLYSCQKEMSTERGIIINTPTTSFGADSIYLDKIFAIDSSGSTIDSGYFLFNYDGQKRINNIVIKTSPDATDSVFWLKFSYNGNDSLPYFIRHVLDSSDYYCDYNSTGKLVRDSVISYGASGGGADEIKVTHLSYTVDKIYADISNSTTGAANLVPAYKDTLNLDARGNVIRSVDYFKDFLTGNYDLSNKTISTFDNNLSPYTRVSGFNMFILAYNIPFLNYDNVFTKNNELTNTDSYYTTTGGSTTLFDTRLVTYTNTYYPNSFLKRAISVTTGPFTSGYSDWKYYYKSL